MINLPPYGNKEHRFHHSDGLSEAAQKQIHALLGVATLPTGGEIYFDLSFFSGGIGVMDKHAISLPADSNVWSVVCSHLKTSTSQELADDKEWGEDFTWLVARDDTVLSASEAAVKFINEERRSFQIECSSEHRCLFGKHSNVNDWVALWGDDARLNYLSYSQG